MSLEKQEKGDGVELDVIVIGAGIAGLSAAIPLSRAGHKVTVSLSVQEHRTHSAPDSNTKIKKQPDKILEKREFKQEAGFMITLGSNAIGVLVSYGFDFRRARAVECKAIETLNGHTLESFQNNGMQEFRSRPELQARTLYRPDLHALWTSKDFVTPVLKLGAQVISANIENATVVLKDGTAISGDLIIGADGERSLVKKKFNHGYLLRQAPYKLFRVIVTTEKLSVDERDKATMASTNNKFATF